MTNLDVKRYAGQWHEVARLPTFFERGVVAARATYGVLPDGSLSVFNEGVKEDGEYTSISGQATLAGDTPDGESKLKVRFARFPASLFTGDYWIFELNDAHTKAIVGSPSRKMLWLLSKDPNEKVTDFKKELQRLKSQGFPIEKLIHNPKRLADD